MRCGVFCGEFGRGVVKFEFLKIVDGDKNIYIGFDEDENFYIQADGFINQARLNLLNVLDGFNFVTTDDGVDLYRVDYLAENFYQSDSEEREMLLNSRHQKTPVDFYSTLRSENFFKGE